MPISPRAFSPAFVIAAICLCRSEASLELSITCPPPNSGRRAFLKVAADLPRNSGTSLARLAKAGIANADTAAKLVTAFTAVRAADLPDTPFIYDSNTEYDSVVMACEWVLGELGELNDK